MKNSLLYLILLTICVALPAAAQSSVTWTWAQQTGSTQRDGAAWTTAEAGGAVYQTGSFRGTITCGSATLTSVGVEDMYLVKYDGQGNVLWARQANNEPVMTSNSGAIGFALTTDGSGNVYVAGSFAGRVTFGNTVLTSPTSTVNSFIVKYNSQGTVQWARMAGGTSSTELRALAVDAANNLVVAGSFRGSTSFGGSTVTSRGDADVVLARLDAATGTTQWLQAAGSSQYDYVTHIAIGAGNAIIIAGGFSSVATFGAINVFSNGGTDGFLAQYNSQGTAQWAQGFGGPGNDSSIRVAVTPTNQIYSVGYFENTATLGAFTLVSQGSSDGYLLNADAQGTVLWARQMGGADSGGAYNLCLSATGAIYVSGRFRSTIVLDNQTLASAGGNDIFVARYDQSGLLAWATRAGGGLNDSDSGLAVNSAGMLYLGGIFPGQPCSALSRSPVVGPKMPFCVSFAIISPRRCVRRSQLSN